MADTTPQKRVLPARERRESAAKRRASSPVVQAASAAKASPLQSSEPRLKRKYNKRASIVKNVEVVTRTSTSTPGAEEILPTKVTASKPLPTLRDKQVENLSARDYQSIADSAIFSASLHRSRMQWLCDGLLKRYWVKPSKRKGVVEQPPGNPDIKTMQKLGNATITIEPHTFDATFYTVREIVPIPKHAHPHPNQHTAKPLQTLSSSHPPPAIQQPATQTTTKAASTQPNTSVTSQPTKQAAISQIKSEPSAISKPTLSSVPKAQPIPPPSGPPKPSDDPVIQMLAARAASDPRLKELMKIVAMSQATPEQLREFQSHIDEFNKIVKQRDATKLPTDPKPKSLPITNSTQPATLNTVQKGSGSAANSPSAPAGPHMAPPYAGYPTQVPPPRPEAIIKHIVVEFHSPVSSTQAAATDRYLFPEHAVLEMRAGGMEMVASFFVERKGVDILRTFGTVEEGDATIRQKYKADQEYFQPVTMLIKATQHRTIETIARAAKPLPEVQTYLKTVMEKKTRAPQEYLVHQLPRDKAPQDSTTLDFADSGIDMSGAEDDELKGYYGI